MQFNFNVNDVLKYPIETFDCHSKLDFYHYTTNNASVKNLQTSQKLSYIIDIMGNASKSAQNLPKVITTSSKLKNSDQRVYLSKDELSNNGNGEIVGLLKVGFKTLFVYDIQGNQHETKPLCVLDFYVHESKQRQGFGKAIFEFMLKKENIEPHNLAIDRPSSKFLSFLAKHYQLTEPVPQANNFVVFSKFFPTVPNCSAYSRNRRYNQQSQYSPMKNSSTYKQLPPQSGDVTNVCQTRKTIVESSPPRVRPMSCTSKDKANLDIAKIPTKTAALCLDPPMLARGDNVQQYRWYLNPINGIFTQQSTSNNCINHTSITNNKNNRPQSNINITNDQIANQALPKISNSKSSTTENIYNCHNGAKSTPSIKNDLKQPMRMCNNSHSRTDYNYSLGLARHYSHNRIW